LPQTKLWASLNHWPSWIRPSDEGGNLLSVHSAGWNGLASVCQSWLRMPYLYPVAVSSMASLVTWETTVSAAARAFAPAPALSRPPPAATASVPLHVPSTLPVSASTTTHSGCAAWSLCAPGGGCTWTTQARRGAHGCFGEPA
jgi:hypothetical protein